MDVIRAIIGPSDASRERILALLQQADNDPNKAVDLYFQSEATNGAALKVNDVEGSDEEEDGDDVAWAQKNPREVTAIAERPRGWTSKAEELSGLLGGEVKRDIILTLLRRTNNDLQQAVEIYFTENGADAEFNEESDDDDDDETAIAAKTPLPPTPKSCVENGTDLLPSPSTISRTVMRPSGATKPPQSPSHSSSVLPQTASVVMPTASHPLAQLSSPALVDRQITDAMAPASTAEEESLYGLGTYEVVMSNSNFRWQIGNVFGRAVVQQVQPGGPAALAGIQKSDVLLAFRETVLNEENCAAVVQQLSKEVEFAAAADLVNCCQMCLRLTKFFVC